MNTEIERRKERDKRKREVHEGGHIERKTQKWNKRPREIKDKER